MKRILLIATGGTIACAEGTDGLAPELTGQELLASVSNSLASVCTVDVVQPMNIDSTDMGPAGWQKIAAAVERGYPSYDGFVVTHGTDTLAYSAAALSYLVQDASKPIVFTGSQLPCAVEGGDAERNLSDALVLASSDDAAGIGVCVAFAGKVIAGTRACKCHTDAFDAFVSVNLPCLGTVGQGGFVLDRRFADELARRVASGRPPRFFHELNTRVGLVKLVPGMDSSVFEAFESSCDALVVEAYGSGGIPTSGNIAASLLDCHDSGCILVVATQVQQGACCMERYAVGRAWAGLRDVVMAADMSQAACLAKTMWALSVTDDPDEFRRLFCAPIAWDRKPAS